MLGWRRAHLESIMEGFRAFFQRIALYSPQEFFDLSDIAWLWKNAHSVSQATHKTLLFKLDFVAPRMEILLNPLAFLFKDQ